MNKMYEAPKAEMIEMQMPVVLMASGPAGPLGLITGDNMGED